MPLSNQAKVYYLGLCFMILFTAFNSLQNMVGQIYKQASYDSLGLISIFTIYGFFSLSSIFAPTISKRLGFKLTFFLSSIGYVLFMASGLLVTFCEDPTRRKEGYCSQGLVYSIVIACSAICGISAINLWISQGWYVGELVDDSNKGKLYSIFWMMMMSSQILGNVLISFSLQSFSHLTYFFITFSIGLVASVLFLFVQPTGKPPTEESLTPSDFIEAVKNFLKREGGFSQAFLYAFLGVTIGIYAGFISGLVEDSLPDSDQQDINFKSGLVFIALGVTQLFTGLTLSKVSDMFSPFSLTLFGTIVVEFAAIVTLLNVDFKSYGACFICSSGWGAAESIMQTSLSVIVSNSDSNNLRAFGIFRFIFSLGVALTLILNVLLKSQPKWIIMVVVLTLQALASMLVPYLAKAQQGKSKSDSAHLNYSVLDEKN